MDAFPPPAPSTPQPLPSPARGNRPIIAGGVALALLAGSGAFLATRGDDGPVTTPASTTTGAVSTPAAPTPTDAPAETALPPDTDAPDTGPPGTEPPAATVVIPDGATDLGYGVYVPATDGVEVGGDGPFTFTGANGVRTILQVLNRDYSEDPNVLLQEYIATWDGDYDHVAYSASTVYEQGYEGHPNLRLAMVRYSILQAEGVLEGKVWAVVRNDGLSLVGDAWGEGETGPLTDVWQELIGSLVNAPPVGDAREFGSNDSVVPPNDRPTAELPFECNCQLVLPPGFAVTNSAGGVVDIEDDVTRFTVLRLEGVASVDETLQAATATLQDRYAVATMEDFDSSTIDLTLYHTYWTGTADGANVYGDMWVLFDPDAEAALVAYTASWVEAPDLDPIVFMVEAYAWAQWTIR